jgi:PIN domain nuclease of toxin-antitoxin system
MNHVLDACAMIAYLRDEPGADVVAGLLADQSHRCYAHAMNLCEVFYDFIRAANIRTARSAVRDLTSVGVRSRHDMGIQLWQDAGRLKGDIRRVSLADCFAIALAAKLEAVVVTSDHHEFDPLAANGICRVEFIR